MYRRGIYNKRGIEPKNIESPFNIDELFFSTTDIKGIILYGNDVFIRVAKFPKDEMFGANHNIIRHPDMPRAVFKALWSTIKKGKPFNGYVKNMAKDGNYYWVFASFYPILDKKGNIKKYISIRIKPSSELFKIIPAFYQDVLKYEYREGMDKALEYMLEKIKELGFKNYEEFAKKAFLEEVSSREKELNKKPSAYNLYDNINKENENFAYNLHSLETLFLRLSKYYTNIFDKIETFLNINKNLSEKSKEILKLAGEIRLLSLNASIESYKIKIEGVSFSRLSQEMRKNAENAETEIKNIANVIEKTNKIIEDTNYNSLSSKLQIDTITYFLREMLNKSSKASIPKNEKEDIMENIKDLFWLLRLFSQKLTQNIYETKRKLINIYYGIKNLNNLIERLNFIHINGLIESAHTKNEGGNFTIIFSQMLSLVETAKDQMENLEMNISLATQDNSNVDIYTDNINHGLYLLQKKFSELLRE